MMFVSPDTLIPDPYHPLDWNRYLYARANPVKYTDPSGHYAVCDDGKCEDGSLKPRNPFVISNDEYESLKKDYGKDKGGNFIVDNALNFLYGLRVHKGWWTPFINSYYKAEAWKFALQLAYSIESYSAFNSKMWKDGYREYMIDAIINKGGDFYRANGYAGLLGFIGGREGLIKRTYPQGSPAWKEGTDAYNAAWSLTNLSKLNSALIDSESFIDEAWSLITNYADKDLFGTGAYDYGQSPPMSCDPNKVIWRQGNQVVIRK